MLVAVPVDARGRSRLLPASVPLRYFGAAVVFLLLAWPMVFLAADAVPGFRGGLGRPLAALHLVTLGVLVMTAIGASLQLLPVATVQAVASVRLAKLVWWLLVPGVALVAAGMALPDVGALALGGLAAGIALTVYAWLLGINLARARRVRLSVVHGWVAWACLVGLLLSAALLVWQYAAGVSIDRGAVVLVHLVVAAFGFMGFMAIGFSYVLVPMFAVARPPDERRQKLVLVIALAALALAVGGSLPNGGAAWLPYAAGIGLGAALLHVHAMTQSIRRRLRKRTGRWLILIAAGWVGLPGSLATAWVVLLGGAPERGPALFGALLVAGWLLSFVLGALERIVPFLASVHALRPQGTQPLVTALVNERALALHRAAHLAALGALLAGIVFDAPSLVRVAAVCGTLSGAAFAWFFVTVIARMRSASTAGRRLRRDNGADRRAAAG